MKLQHPCFCTSRLQCLLQRSDDELVRDSIVDRALMYSELARCETFHKWPHMTYKWALPEKMAQAGFFHQPAASGEDRANCFACDICLVCWEPTDEPWYAPVHCWYAIDIFMEIMFCLINIALGLNMNVTHHNVHLSKANSQTTYPAKV